MGRLVPTPGEWGFGTWPLHFYYEGVGGTFSVEVLAPIDLGEDEEMELIFWIGTSSYPEDEIAYIPVPGANQAGFTWT